MLFVSMPLCPPVVLDGQQEGRVGFEWTCPESCRNISIISEPVIEQWVPPMALLPIGIPSNRKNAFIHPLNEDYTTQIGNLGGS